MARFVPRQRKHKVLARQKAAASGPAENNDANAVQIVPLGKDEREAKKQRMRDELRAQQPKMSAKKQKRLDKYIENKLKKDETIELVRKLEKEKEKWDSRGLMSSKNLGKRAFDEFVNGQLDKTPDHEVIEIKKTRTNGSEIHSRPTDHDDDDTASEDSFETENKQAFDDRAVLESDEAWVSKRAPLVQGSGLANPLQTGADGLPIIPTRAGKRKKTRDLNARALEQLKDAMEEDIPWEGFDSEPDYGSEELSGSGGGADSQSQSSSRDTSDEESGDWDDDSGGGEENSEDSASETSASDLPSRDTQIKPRASAFKAWATQQLNQAVGHVPSYAANGEGELPVHNPKQDHPASTKSISSEAVKLINGLPEVKTPTVQRQIHSVQIDRSESVLESRRQLPILQHEQAIMEAIYANPVVVVKGETGSGKTTQLPQFLYEAGYGDPNGPTPGMIGVTQPRRVAAVSMAKRVGVELADHGSRVAHQIRFDSTVSSNTAIKFMTDGILLRELSQDLLLKKYSAIIIDEAHERSVNTDILIGMLSKIVPARMRKDKFNPDPKPLKLIIMSATLNIEDFLHEKLFAPNLKPPVVEAEGRQHRVTTHFALRSRADYLEEMVEKIKRAHRKLPKGGILAFLTGQNEIKQVQARLRKEIAQAAGQISNTVSSKMHITASETPLEVEDIDFGTVKRQLLDEDDEVDILTHSDEEAEEREFEISDDDDDDNANEDNEEQPANSTSNNLTAKPNNSNSDPYDTVHILPLYSQLPTQEQLRVFQPPPPRSRLIVLATNVAETSLTIPGIRYVFDSGRSKERRHDPDTGVQSFEVDYVSKASASQRAGRAGRTGPGHCWRLYTSAVYERFFPDHAEPEIRRVPAENVVLMLRGFAYPRPVVEFPFPTPPGAQALQRAERLLKDLGALGSGDGADAVTPLGRRLSVFPLPPRLGKILISAIDHHHGSNDDKTVLARAVALVAGLAVGDIYITADAATGEDEGEGDEGDGDEQDARKQKYGRAQATLSRHDKTSDGMKLSTAVCMYTGTDSDENKEDFCARYFVKPKAMQEIAQLQLQLHAIIAANYHSSGTSSASSIAATAAAASSTTTHKLSTATVKTINAVAASGYIDQVAVRWDCAPNPPTLASRPRRAIDVPYLPLTPLRQGPGNTGPTTISDDLVSKAVFIHPSSVLARLPPKELPQYIIYTHLQRSQARTVGVPIQPKTRMYPLTPIDAATLARLARGSALLRYGKPVPKMKVEDVPSGTTGTDGRRRQRGRICWVGVELRASTGGAGTFGWPLPPVKVRQVVDLKSHGGWRVEEVLS